MTERVSTGLPKLDAMLGGGLLPGTLTVVYGATGIGKTHLGLTVANHGAAADAARGILLDLNGRGDSQQHDEYAARLFDWKLRPWTHTVTPMSDPYPPPDQLEAFYCNVLRWVGRVRDLIVVEVAYNEIQRSPTYPSGLALRFARITRIRDDKGPGQATTLAELRALYERQFRAKGRASRPVV
ncbi:MAG: hypothetical protein A2050_13025 [Candidatus Rokubacteria bacterium GWA2_73_35]|nr:MAG: hypothetical protein A2050_13025 [Candidatus Rokubacteria bacterium GWA2_73_35]